MSVTGTVHARPDTHEMVVVHRVFRQGFRELPALLRAVPDGDTNRAAVVAGALAELSTALHHHHTNEDETLWPLLLERVLGNPGHQALVLRMEEQHERVAARVERVEGIAATFAASARPEDRDRLAAAVEALCAALEEHLHDEEVHVLPLCEQYVTTAEWEAGAERARAAIPKDRLLVQLGAILSHCSPAEARAFLAKLPVQARLAWWLVGRRAYRRERAQLLGG